MTEEVPMRGAALGDRGLVRVGDTVRRPAGPWTASVQHLLGSLRAYGFDVVPEPLGIDEYGRETLRFVEGRDLGWPLLPGIRTTDGAERLGRLAARLRVALASYRCPEDAHWQFADGPPGPGRAIQHGDLGPWNLLWGRTNDAVAAVLDWDFAGPGDPCYDTGLLAWFVVPLMDDERAHERGFPEPPDRRARLRAYAAGTGVEEDELVEFVVRAQEESARRIVERRSSGGVWQAVYDRGLHESAAADRDWTARHFA